MRKTGVEALGNTNISNPKEAGQSVNSEADNRNEKQRRNTIQGWKENNSFHLTGNFTLTTKIIPSYTPKNLTAMFSPLLNIFYRYDELLLWPLRNIEICKVIFIL